MTPENISAASAVAQTLLLFTALLYAGGQIREARRARRAQTALYAFDRLNTPASSAVRQYVFQVVALKLDSLDPADEKALAQVVNDFHVLGYLLRAKMIDEAVVLEMYYGTIIRCWLVARDWILEERVRRGTLYAEYVEYLYIEAVDYVRKERPGMVVRVPGTSLEFIG